jgi:hypothetical protein
MSVLSFASILAARDDNVVVSRRAGRPLTRRHLRADTIAVAPP